MLHFILYTNLTGIFERALSESHVKESLLSGN